MDKKVANQWWTLASTISVLSWVWGGGWAEWLTIFDKIAENTYKLILEPEHIPSIHIYLEPEHIPSMYNYLEPEHISSIYNYLYFLLIPDHANLLLQSMI